MPLTKLLSAFAKRKSPHPITSSALSAHSAQKTAFMPAKASDIGSKLLDAVALHKQGQLARAEAAYQEILQAQPRHFDALHYLGLMALQRGKTEEGIALIGQALEIDAKHPAALGNLAMALRQLGRHEEALAHYRRALDIKPDSADIGYNFVNTLLNLQRHEEALDICSRTLRLIPNAAPLLQQRGTALLLLRRYEESIADFDRALALQPDYPEALANRGVALTAINRNADAVASYTRVLQLNANDVEARYNRGISLAKLGRLAEALIDYEQVLQGKPDHLGALNNLGTALSALGRFEAAIPVYKKLLALAPDYDYAPGNLFACQLYCCDWSDYEKSRQAVVEMNRQGRKAAVPFPFLNASESPADQLACARAFVAHTFPASSHPLWTGRRYQHEKIRVAYLSADFQEHATAHLMAGLFEAHDRQRFETIAISYGPDARGGMRERLQSAFDRFIDVREKSDLEAARIMQALEVDIAVDLKGFTENSRLGILAHRPSPVQVSYLGYPGTTGADYVDYAICDKHLVSEGELGSFSEQLVFLPDSYQVNDSKRPISAQVPTRAEAGLPEKTFVFCSFNNNYKITPAVFDIWMRLLHQIAGSVLWLYEGNAAAAANLRREAQARGIAPEQLVFAPRLPQAEHLARQQLADLFLDTLPVNAHTTASDALWAGLPVLTCTGQAFAGRVATSLLHAVGLPELVTQSLDEYEALALRLASMPAELARIKAKLAHNRSTYPLFNTVRFCRHLEAAYVEMWERSQRGEAPAGFSVPAMLH
ncbi:tetratricopeptide repeat protein [Noviherbaspirillum massiliense]|uniref:tetratricopeptide repeat protein n=1 Tax=Noviherbaspirillum massiliense TaxID=1465823 RepID=UPI0002EF46B1|nr:tetratricopeptide repeat protein [Noviherbaspirillum massiliense]